MSEIRAVACNYTEPTKVAAAGARAYVVLPNPGNAGERVRIILRSRGGRWVDKWEDSRRLGNFRPTTIVEAEGEPFDKAMPSDGFREGIDEWCAWMNDRYSVKRDRVVT